MAKYGLFKYGLAKYGLVGTTFTPIYNFKNKISKEIEDYSFVKVEILDNFENAIGMIEDKDIIEIQTTYTNQNGVRKTATMTLYNEDNKYTPKYREIWLNTRFKIYSGKMINGVEKLYPRGVYVILSAQIDDGLDQSTITYSLSDKYSLMLGGLAGTLPTDIIIDGNVTVTDALRIVHAMSSDKKNPLITNTNIDTFYPFVCEIGGCLDDLIKPLADTISYQYGYNVHGIFELHPEIVDSYMEYSNKASVYDFTQDDINLIETSNIQDFTKIKNSIVVVGENILGNLVRSEISDNYIFSNTRKELIEERVKVITGSNLYTQELCDARAEYELFIAIRLQEEINITCLVIDYIQENSIITITNKITGLQERYLVNSVNYSSNSSTMSLSVWKIRSVI